MLWVLVVDVLRGLGIDWDSLVYGLDRWLFRVESYSWVSWGFVFIIILSNDMRIVSFFDVILLRGLGGVKWFIRVEF